MSHLLTRFRRSANDGIEYECLFAHSAAVRPAAAVWCLPEHLIVAGRPAVSARPAGAVDSSVVAVRAATTAAAAICPAAATSAATVAAADRAAAVAAPAATRAVPAAARPSAATAAAPIAPARSDVARTERA